MNNTNNITMILQTGAWDLAYTSLRNIINPYYAAPTLINIITKLLNNTLLCTGLKHIIWVTSVPYPICQTTRELCFHNQGFRTNTNIAALNTFYLNHFNHLKFNLKSNISIHFSIIDAYSIIKPRLGFDEDKEVLDGHHYLFREKIPGQKKDYKLYYTPGGKAVIDSIIEACRY